MPNPTSGQADQKTLFFISNSHLDTQWNWDVKTTINEYVRNTMEQNFTRLDKYPNLTFNFEGAIRYMWMKEYYPEQYAKLKTYVQNGRWHISGCAVDANDVMGFWNSTIALLDDMASQGMIRGNCHDYIEVATSLSELQQMVEQ